MAQEPEAQQDENPEPRREVVGVRVTEQEKRAVRLVSGIRDTTESDLLRDWTIADIMAEAERIRARHAGVAAIA